MLQSIAHSETYSAPAGGLHDLMERYVDGDDRAFAALHRRLEPRVRSRLGRMLRDEALVEDLVQQTFMRAHQARTRYAAGTSQADKAVEGWYLAIARNVALDHLRHTYRRERRHSVLASRGEVEGMGVPETTPDPETSWLAGELADERARSVRSAIDQLPKSQRDVVTLHKLRGLGMSEIADRLGVRPGALRVRAHRAYKALARLLSPAPAAVA
jgi:RNA polymerase sigma-70 factor (ECF subfamily)